MSRCASAASKTYYNAWKELRNYSRNSSTFYVCHDTFITDAPTGSTIVNKSEKSHSSFINKSAREKDDNSKCGFDDKRDHSSVDSINLDPKDVSDSTLEHWKTNIQILEFLVGWQNQALKIN